MCDMHYVLHYYQNQSKMSALERDLDVNEQERSKLLTEKGRLEQEAEVGFDCVCAMLDVFFLL